MYAERPVARSWGFLGHDGLPFPGGEALPVAEIEVRVFHAARLGDVAFEDVHHGAGHVSHVHRTYIHEIARDPNGAAGDPDFDALDIEPILNQKGADLGPDLGIGNLNAQMLPVPWVRPLRGFSESVWRRKKRRSLRKV